MFTPSWLIISITLAITAAGRGDDGLRPPLIPEGARIVDTSGSLERSQRHHAWVFCTSCADAKGNPTSCHALIGSGGDGGIPDWPVALTLASSSSLEESTSGKGRITFSQMLCSCPAETRRRPLMMPLRLIYPPPPLMQEKAVMRGMMAAQEPMMLQRSQRPCTMLWVASLPVLIKGPVIHRSTLRPRLNLLNRFFVATAHPFLQRSSPPAITHPPVLIARRGVFRQDAHGAIVLILDAQETSAIETPLVLLPTTLHHRAHQLASAMNAPTSVLVTGEVVTYRSRRFLLPSSISAATAKTTLGEPRRGS